MKKPKKSSVFVRHPLLMAGCLATIYFMMDGFLLDKATGHDLPKILFCLGASFLLFLFGYPMESIYPGTPYVPAWVKHPKRYQWGGLGLIILIAILGVIFYQPLLLRWFPNLGEVYYPANVVLFLVIAPIMEELTFRYLLYDRWAKPKYGKGLGMLAAGIIFVLCHPVTDWRTLCLYWIPTIMFFLVYEDFGIYGSILAHMIYNFLAL